MSLQHLKTFILFAISLMLIATIPFGAARKQKYTVKEVKCHVCKAVVEELKSDVDKVPPERTIEIGGYRLDGIGNSVAKTVPLAKSEVFLNEIMENVCGRMEDYVKANLKSNGEFTLLKIMINGAMNPKTSEVDIIQDDDLNRSLSHYCLELIEDLETTILKAFQGEKMPKNVEHFVCSQENRYCEDDDEDEEEVISEHTIYPDEL